MNDFLKAKLESYSALEKNFENMFSFMFSESDTVMAEYSEGYKIKRITYGEAKNKVYTLSCALSLALSNIPKGSMVGLYMANSAEWIETFWAILMCGYSPLLMNSRMTDDILCTVLEENGVTCIISDGKTFPIKTVLSSELFEADNGVSYTPDKWGSEVLFMSSGTTGSVKLCAYTAENFYYQLCDSVDIVKECPQIAKGDDGTIRLLALLPFYHVFGFIAVYMWFGFFSSTYVFLNDLRPQTLLSTIQRHKVTHIFAVPLVWETVYKEATKKIRARGDKTYEKFLKALALSNKNPALGKLIAGRAFAEIRQSLFGDSIRFMISGGSGIKKEILEFFNGIGYTRVNGYGMTEVGITSVELSSVRSVINRGSIGHPMQCTQYSVSEKGELLVKGKTMASAIIQNGVRKNTDYGEWFNTHDLTSCDEAANKYYLHGRRDDLVVCENGENLNPEIIEKQIYVKGINRLCLFADEEGRPILIVSVLDCFSSRKLHDIYDSVMQKLRENHLSDEIKAVVITSDRLLSKDDFKLSRKKVAARYANGQYNIIDVQHADKHIETMLSELENQLIDCFAEALQIDRAGISVTSDFFGDLGGSSLNYFALIDILKTRFGIETEITESPQLVTVRDFCRYIEEQNK